jgi:hypothetical protein
MQFAVKSVEMAKMNIKPLEVRSNSLGCVQTHLVAFKRKTHGRLQASSAREARVALAGPMLHHFSLTP